jgi:hypothetical protein
MTNSDPDSLPPTSASKAKKRACVLCSVMLAVAATLVAIVMVVLVGMASWGAVVGTRGLWIGAMVGAAAGLALRRRGHWLPRLIGGFLGGMIGGYFAVAAAEQALPGDSRRVAGCGIRGSCRDIVRSGCCLSGAVGASLSVKGWGVGDLQGSRE